MAEKDDYVRVIKGQRWLIGVLLLAMGFLFGAGTMSAVTGSDIGDNKLGIALNESEITHLKVDLAEIKIGVNELLMRIPARQQ